MKVSSINTLFILWGKGDLGDFWEGVRYLTFCLSYFTYEAGANISPNHINPPFHTWVFDIRRTRETYKRKAWSTFSYLNKTP